MANQRVILYSTGCPKCRVLKQKLDAKKVDYVEKNQVEEMESLGITSVPLLVADDNMLEFSDAIKWVNSI